MKIKIRMPDGKTVAITLPDGLGNEEIQKEVDGVEAAYLLDANPEYLSSNATSEQQANAPLRARKAIMAEQQPAIEQARMQAMEEEGPTILPYLRQARVEGDNETGGALKDVAAMIPRGYVALQELYANDGYVDATPKTSEEYFQEGSTAKGILTSPSLLPSTLAAVATSGMSTPTQVGAQVVANYDMMEDYGGANLGLDAILTALPAGVGFVAGKTKSAGVAAIRKALEAKGLKNVSDDVLEQAYEKWGGKAAGEAISKKAGAKLEALLPTAPPPSPRSGILSGVMVGHEPIDFKRVRNLIAASTRQADDYYGVLRTEDEAAEALAKIDALEARLALLSEKSRDPAGVFRTSYDSEKYKQEMVAALSKAADIPELLAVAEATLTPAGRKLKALSIEGAMKAANGQDLGEEHFQKVLEAAKTYRSQNLGGTLAALRTGRVLQGGLRPEVSAGRAFMEPRATLADMVKGNAPAVLKLGEEALRAGAPASPAALLPYRARLNDFYQVRER